MKSRLFIVVEILKSLLALIFFGPFLLQSYLQFLFKRWLFCFIACSHSYLMYICGLLTCTVNEISNFYLVLETVEIQQLPVL